MRMNIRFDAAAISAAANAALSDFKHSDNTTNQLMQTAPLDHGQQEATVESCTLCSATAIIETRYLEFRWGGALCGRCSAVAELMLISQSLPYSIRPYMTDAMMALARAWRQVLQVCTDMNRRISMQYNVESDETEHYPSPP